MAEKSESCSWRNSKVFIQNRGYSFVKSIVHSFLLEFWPRLQEWKRSAFRGQGGRRGLALEVVGRAGLRATVTPSSAAWRLLEAHPAVRALIRLFPSRGEGVSPTSQAGKRV